ncbi:MAG: hypothetical protein CMP38_01380 [Rickettsiales bacterium]|nr:hypothetical protein [Rickettsiales bacterium]OUW05431.1 MAG: hypothetical protein CBD16_01000 [Betaproteobacteria bacterium TMED156]|tara:strand:+ start:356 stop:1162 length:807 start_codon:yes stop_codon:yes gene_type:complete
MWYSTKILSKNRKDSLSNCSYEDKRNESKEQLFSKSFDLDNSQKSIHEINNTDGETDMTEKNEEKETRKISKTKLIIFLTALTIFIASGQHLFASNLDFFSNLLKSINVGAFETKNEKLIIDNERKSFENFSRNKIAQSQGPRKKSAPHAKFSRSLVLLDLEDWRKNWSARNLEGFMGYYHPDFKDIKVFRNNKKRIFKKNRFIKISLKNISSRVEGDYIITEFTQIYKSKNYNDSATKELIWARTEFGWKILEENIINPNVAKRGKK